MHVDEWIARYARAWENADENAAVELFTPDASYRSNIFEEPYVGRDAIRQYWTKVTSTQSEVVVRTGRPIASEQRVAIEWWATMSHDGQEITLPGCLLLTFDEVGLCRELWEYWHVEPGRRDPPDGWGGTWNVAGG